MNNATAQLPEPGTPITLPDGRKIDPATGRLLKDGDVIEIPSNSAARDIVVGARRKLVDLPEVPRKMNVISIVIAYSLFGLEDDEIAIALELPKKQVQVIKSLEAYDDMLRNVIKNIKDTDTDEVTQTLHNGALSAARRVIELANHGEDDNIRLAASKDVLDRTNYRPKDTREINVNINDTLLIERVTRTNASEAPQIDVKDVIDGEFIEHLVNGKE
jgi:hypothetical protein